MEERAAEVGSIFFADFFLCFCSSGSRQMLGRRRMVSCVVGDGSSNADSGIAGRSRKLEEEACSRA